MKLYLFQFEMRLKKSTGSKLHSGTDNLMSIISLKRLLPAILWILVFAMPVLSGTLKDNFNDGDFNGWSFII